MSAAASALRIVLPLLTAAGMARAAAGDFFALEFLDAETGRGVPLVQAETVNHLRFVSDSAGLIAISEPDLKNTRVFFQLASPGYEITPNDAGEPGVTALVQPGKVLTVKLKRKNLAERLYRLTGTGTYRDSVLLDRIPPIVEPLVNGGVAGQDSLLSALFHERVYWFSGDSLRLRSTQGNYWSAGATSELPSSGGLDPAKGIDLHYFQDDEGFVRPIWPRTKEGSIWTDGLLTTTDEAGVEQMLAHFTQLNAAGETVDHGVGVFDAQKHRFDRRKSLPPEEGWRFPAGHPTLGRDVDEGYYLMPAPGLETAPFLAVRVKADAASVLEPESYVAFTCLRPGTDTVERDAAGSPIYDWKPGGLPLSPKNERALIAAGLLQPSEALYQPRDIETGKTVEFRSGSVHWNNFRKTWVMIAEELGPQGFSGEIYYAESASPVGPWRAARKVATHTPYRFYNPAQLPFLDQEEGRFIYIQGTFLSPTGAAQVARYDFNALVYRLDLSDERLWRGLK